MARFRVGDWLVEPDLDRLVRDGEITTIEPRVMSVLVHLARHAGEVVSSDDFVDVVWHGGAVGPGSIYQNIAQLRKLLGDNADNPTYICTIPRKGYRLIAPVESVSEGLDDAAEKNRIGRPLLASRRLYALIAVAIFVAAAILGYDWLSTPPATSGQASIAVLPFADLSEHGENEYFCDGLSEELLNGLAKVPGLRVAARTSSFAFKGKQMDIRAIGRRLKVSHILEGSVRKSDSRIKITAQLIDVSSGFHLWTESYERSLDDVFVIQEEISRAVVDVLEIRLASRVDERLALFPTADIDAYDFYLLGRHYWRRRTHDSLNRAIAYFEQAIAIDPDFALAYTGLADSYTGLMYYGNWSLQQATTKALPNIVHALKLDDQLAEAHASLGLIRKDHQDYAAADISLQQAIRLNPNYALAHLWYGISLHEQGELQAALASYQQAIELDPLSFFVNIRMGVTLLLMGRHEESFAQFQKGIELAPDHPNSYWGLGLIELEQGRLDEAVQWYAKALSLDPGRAEFLMQLGWIYLDMGDYDSAEQVFDRVAASNPSDENLKLPKSWWYIARDDYDGLLNYLHDRVLKPSNELGVLLNAGFYEMLSGNVDGALVYYRQAIDKAGLGEDVLFMVWDLHWGTSHSTNLANVYLRLGMEEEGKALIDKTLAFIEQRRERGAVEHGTYYVQASLHALDGETDKGLAALEKAAELGWRRVWWAERDPNLASLKGESRFEELLARVRKETAAMQAQPALPAEAGRPIN